MKVVILCGGKGTRLRDETEYKPKPMVEIGDRPILWHIMKCYSHYGFNDFILCMGYRHQSIRDYFLNYRHMNSDVTVSLGSGDISIPYEVHDENWNVTLAYTGPETKKGARIKLVNRYLDNQRFMLTYGDGVSDVDIGKLISNHEQSGALATFTGVQAISRFATVEQDTSGKIVQWSEKKPLEDYINGGFFVMEPEVLDYISGDVELEEEPMRLIAEDGKLSMYKHHGFWQCMDTYRDYLYLNDLWNTGEAPWKVWR